VADAYDAMTTDRPYRLSMSHDEAVTELRRNGGGQFDPRIVDAFIDSFRDTGTVAFPVRRALNKNSIWTRHKGPGTGKGIFPSPLVSFDSS